jgi:protein NrfD
MTTHEITTTRMNPMIDPGMHIWGWEIPVYLFLGGLVAGFMVISGYFLFSGRFQESRHVTCFRAPLTGLILISLGMIALFLDLEHKLYAWRLYTTIKIASPMSWGAWILVLVYPAMAIMALIHLPDQKHLPIRVEFLHKLSQWLRSHEGLAKSIGAVNMLGGAILGMYTGVLLSSLGARPLWSSSSLWLLFLVSGMSATAAFIHMVAPTKAERELLAKADNGFLSLELFVLALYLIGLATTSDVHADAVRLLISGAYAPVFWIFVIGVGIVIPLVIQILAVNHKVKHTSIPPLMVIAGGLILRFVIVMAGQHSHWSNTHGL